MLTPLNQQLGQTPQMPPMVATPAVGNSDTPFVQPTPTTPTRGIGAQMAAQGRGPDSALVHMAPNEVAGLDALAKSTVGQGLTINPTTGLPEAGILSSLLPMILGAALSPFITPMGAAAVVGLGTGLVKHDLKAGLMAGLSAFGGAGLGGAIGGMMSAGSAAAAGAGAGAIGGGAASGIAGDIAATAAPTAGAGFTAAETAANAAQGLTPLATQTASTLGSAASHLAPLGEISAQATPEIIGGSNLASGANAVLSNALPNTAAYGEQAGLRGLASGFGSKFAEALRPGVPGFVPRMVTTGLGTTGVLNSAMGAMTPSPMTLQNDPSTTGKSNYAGPYLPVDRHPRMPGADRSPTDSSEFQYFEDVNPTPGYMTMSGGAPPGYPGGPALVDTNPTTTVAKKHWYDFAQGGVVSLKPGGFVMDARTVSELGNGSSNAGKELLAQHGGTPIDGPGDGVSDSIPARISGGREARVARDEVAFSPEAVKRAGGAQKLYAVMDAARKSRAQAGRGQDTGSRRGLSGATA